MHVRPKPHSLIARHSSPLAPSVATGEHTKPDPKGWHESSPEQPWTSGSQSAKHRGRNPPLSTMQEFSGSSQLGACGFPLQSGTHTPVPSVYAPEHSRPKSQLSKPEGLSPSTVQGSPSPRGTSTIGTQRAALIAEPPSSAHGLHF